MDIKNELSAYKLTVDQYGILRNPKLRPRCPNELLEKVVKKKLSTGLSAQEEQLYGNLLMTLARIVLNNAKFKHQEENLRMECFSEMMLAFEGAERCFDWGKGSKFYSYLFRCMYTQGIHVLESKNKRSDLQTNLISKMMDDRLDCGCRVGPVCSSTQDSDVRRYFVQEFDECPQSET
jgi:hypothetical protein